VEGARQWTAAQDPDRDESMSVKIDEEVCRGSRLLGRVETIRRGTQREGELVGEVVTEGERKRRWR
jgi:hypothetical protein